jgi:hypothetical protein
VAYQAAFGLSLVCQAAALVWFAIPWIRTLGRNVFGDSLEALLGPAALLLTSPSLKRAQAAIGKQDIGCLNAISAKHPETDPLCSP